MRIVLSYEYFYPAYKAGGPIQSINNLASHLAEIGNDVFIFCSDRDLDGTVLDVETDTWTEYSTSIKVFYNSKTINSLFGVSRLLANIKPDYIFINGLYSLIYTIYPLMYNGSCQKVLSVRGMLHPGALSQKSFKKNVFLKLFKTVGLDNKCEYHSTSDSETDYIHDVFGDDKKVWMIPNLPNMLPYQEPLRKEKGKIKLVSVSLISPMKNILRVIEELETISENVEYDIYGPVKDAAYWEKCKEAIGKSSNPNVIISYKQEVTPDEIPNVLSSYHCMILPSKSENFGHALYESMAAGKPVITSHNTPWNGLGSANAGRNINPDEPGEIRNAVEELAMLSASEYEKMAIDVRQYITKQYNIEHIKSAYNKMFSSEEIKVS